VCVCVFCGNYTALILYEMKADCVSQSTYTLPDFYLFRFKTSEHCKKREWLNVPGVTLTKSLTEV